MFDQMFTLQYKILLINYDNSSIPDTGSSSDLITHKIFYTFKRSKNYFPGLHAVN